MKTYQGGEIGSDGGGFKFSHSNCINSKTLYDILLEGPLELLVDMGLEGLENSPSSAILFPSVGSQGGMHELSHF